VPRRAVSKSLLLTGAGFTVSKAIFGETNRDLTLCSTFRIGLRIPVLHRRVRFEPLSPTLDYDELGDALSSRETYSEI
jgi:hypothetical protein